MATKEEAQQQYDDLRKALADGRRRVSKIVLVADRADEIVGRVLADDDLKTKFQACVDAGPGSLTSLKAEVSDLRAVSDVIAVKYPPPPPPEPEPVVEAPDPEPDPTG